MSCMGAMIFIQLLVSLSTCRGFPVASGVWNDLTTDGLNGSLEKVEFRFGPFESSTEDLRTSESYVESFNVHRPTVLEKLTRSKFPDSQSRPERKQRKTGNEPMLSILGENSSDTLWKLSAGKLHGIRTEDDSDGEPPSSSPSSSKALEHVLAKLRAIKDQMREIKKLSVFLDGFREGNAYQIDNNGLSGNPMQSSRKNSDSEGKENANRKNHSSNLSRSIANEFKSVNNLTHGSQYQIGNIFIFNQLSDKGKLNIDVEHYPQFPFPRKLADTDETVQRDEDELSEMFFSNGPPRLAPDKMNHMSRVIDFVERYHGMMTDFEADERKPKELKEDGGKAAMGK